MGMRLGVGERAPEFSGRTTTGEVVGVGVLRDVPWLMVVFWKVDCEASRAVLARICAQYPTQVRAIGIVQGEDADAGTKLARSLGVRFPILSDRPPYPLSLAYDPAVTPTLFLVDAVSGRVDLVLEAFSKAELNELAARLALAAGQEPVPVARAGDGLPDLVPG
jgi:peroxiredoxin